MALFNADFAQSNDALKQMLQWKIQQLMADRSLQRQTQYLERSNELYGQREMERIGAEGQKQMEVAGYKHGLDMAKIHEQNLEWAARQEPIKRIAYILNTETDPARRKKLEDMMDAYWQTLADASVKSLTGKSPTEQEIAFLGQFSSPAAVGKHFNTMSANIRAYRTAGIQERGVGIREKGLGLQEQKFEWQKAQPPKGKDINDQVAAKAKEVLTYLGKKGARPGLEEEGVGGEDTAGMLLGVASEIQSRAIRKEFSDPTEAKKALDFLDMIYRSKAKAAEKLGAMEWLKKEEARRALSTTAGPDQYGFTVGETKVSPRDGKPYTYIGNNQWKPATS